MDDFKGNSNASKMKQEKQPEQRVTEAVTNKVTVRKENELKKFGKQFISEDAKTVRGHIVDSVVVPGIQRLVVDVVTKSIDWIIYGVRGSSKNNNGGFYRDVHYTNYNRSGSNYSQIPRSTEKSSQHSFNNYYFDNRGEAETVLSRMRDIIERYGMVSVADFYDLISQRHDYTDNKYGWRDLKSAQVDRTRDNDFIISFPRIIVLE